MACCHGHSAPAKAFCDAYFARSPWMVWRAARGVGGKSYMLSALAWIEAVTLQASVSVLGGSGEQSERVHDYMRGFWMRENAPTHLLSDEPSQRKTRLVTGNHIEAQLASSRSVRGFHGARLRIDEADEVEWKIADASRGQAMDQRGVLSNVVFSSTMQYSDGTMSKLLAEAADRGMPVHQWCYKETLEPHGWLSERSMERYRATVSAELWRIEVELGEPSPEGRAIVSEKVDLMFMGESFPISEGEYKEFEPPVEGAEYATGADWAKETHYTEIVTLRCDVFPMRLVAYERLRRRPMPEMVGRLDARIRRYPGDACHDNTGGGNYLADWIEEPVMDVNMVGKVRSDLFSNYVAAVEHEEIVSPRVEPLYSQHKFVKNEDLYTSSVKGHPPDGVVACAMAYKASLSSRKPMRMLGGNATRGASPLPPPPEGVKSALDFLARRPSP